MNLAAALVASLALASAGGAVIAADLGPADGPFVDPAPPAAGQGCDHCNGTSNQTQEPEQNQTAPPEPEPEPVAEPIATAEVAEACEASSFQENGTFTKTALGGSGASQWAFDVACDSSQVVIELVLSGWSDLGAYVDFDNRFHVFAGNGTDVAQAHTGLSYALDGDHLLFHYASEGPVSAGEWLFDLTECFLLGDYALSITVS